MEYERVIKERISIRKFSDKMVEEEKLLKILEAGRIAPTAKNKQPQRILVAKSKEALEKIDRVSPCRYNAPICLLVCSDKDEASVLDGHSFYETDACIVATQMMLMATDLGVDNIWIGYFDLKKTQEEFDLPSNIIPICILPIGHRASDCPLNPNHKKRKPLEETVKYI